MGKRGPKPRLGPVPKCSVGGCLNQRQTVGLCNMHYLRMRSHGALDKPPTSRIDRTGRRYGRLMVIAFDRVENRKAHWLCRCDCGAEIVVIGTALANGNTRSCGCLRHDRISETKTTHGQTVGATPSLTYNSWRGAKERCSNPNHIAWKSYGGRGIEFRFASVADLIADIGERPAAGLSLDRVNNDGHYEAGNVRWADSRTQARNSRPRPTRPRGPDGRFL